VHAQVDVRNVHMNRRGHYFAVSLLNSNNVGQNDRINDKVFVFWADVLCCNHLYVTCIAPNTTDV